MITEPGLYELPAGEYHADPCEEPSLSSGLARTLLTHSPKHAWWAHPRLNPDHEPEHSTAFDIGTAAHALLLEGESGVVVIEAKDYKTQAARAERDAAYAAHKVPLLVERWQDVQDMVEAARIQLGKHAHRPVAFEDGQPEQVLIWREPNGVWCRARLDWFHTDRRTIGDFKTTSGSANPEAWIRRTLFGMGYDVQDSFYRRGARAVLGVDPGFYFVVQEMARPFALSVVSLDRAAVELADEKVAHAIQVWGECQRSQRWPGYPTRTCWAQLPPWEHAQWLERQAFQSWARGLEDDGRPLGELLAGEER